MKQTLLKAFMLMLVAVFATSATADNTFTAADGNTYKWVLNDDGTTATITGCTTNQETDLDIPEKVTADNKTWYTVTEIGNWALGGRSSHSIKLPSTLVKIGSNAFSADPYFTSITIPASVTEIGACAFQYCSDLKTVIINASSSLKIGDAAFSTDIIDLFVKPGSLESVIITSETPPTLYKDPNYKYGTTYPYFSPSAKIYVPDATDGKATTSAQYKYKQAWSDYSSKIYRYFDKKLAGPFYGWYYSTLALPYAVEIPSEESTFAVYTVSTIKKNEGLSAATMTKISSASVTTKAYIPAKTGVVLKSNSNAYIPRFFETTENVTSVADKLQPCIEDGGLPNDYTSYLTLGPDKEMLAQGLTVLGFYLYTGATIARNTAYMKITDAGAKKMTLTFDENTTSIKGVEEIDQSQQNMVFDLQGRRVMNPRKGNCYIINGKKVIY